MRTAPSLASLLAASAAACALAGGAPPSLASTQYSYKELYAFFSNPDGPSGASPTGPLFAASDGYGYGVTCDGGRFGQGSLYRMTRNGAVRTMHSFKQEDGVCPHGRLIQASDGNLYGIALRGGTHWKGTVWRIDSAGKLAVVYSFTGGKDGGWPTGGVSQASDGNLYGLSYGGDGEVVYRLSLAGDFATIYSLDTSTHGYFAVNGLTYASNGYLYGQTLNGGAFDQGSVFRVSLAGESTVVHAFGAFPADTASARSALVEGQDEALYGTSTDGGANGAGTFFRVGLDDQYAVIQDFDLATTGTTDAAPAVDAAGNVYVATTRGILRFDQGQTLDGRFPKPAYAADTYLTFGPDQHLYGVSRSGGAQGAGMIFRIKERAD